VATVVIFAGRRMRTLSNSAQAAMGDLTNVLDESISGQRVVKIFGGQQYEQKLRRGGQAEPPAGGQARRHVGLQLRPDHAADRDHAVVGDLFALIRAQAGALSAGGFVAFLTALMAMQSPIKNLTKINEPMQRGLAAAASVFGLIDLESEADKGTKTIARAEGRLSVQDVSFHYRGADGKPLDPDARPALDHVSLDIAAGETVALVGSSGSGKTTLAGLLPRFYDVSEGSIQLDGVDLRDYTMTSLRQQIALVSQDVVLFNDTLAANIAYGDPAPSMERIEAAAKAAYAHEFIVRQPEGYNTPVGENGVRLSGGQRQRLAIARALYKNAPILILDEATSALDTESERLVQQALEVLMKGRTTVVIAHRLSTIENADRIVVLDRGRIAESGTTMRCWRRTASTPACIKRRKASPRPVPACAGMTGHKPPSPVKLAPVTKPASPLARYATIPATSSGLPKRRAGIMVCSAAACGPSAGFMSVSVGPGCTLLTVMPRGARSIAAPRTSAATAPLVIEYTLEVWKATRMPAMLPMVTMRPPSFITLAAACTATNTPRTLVATMRSKSSSG
jgi:ABC-type transport system involved in cytochrome bd biosynthesis fused ATPase/permease subunit